MLKKPAYLYAAQGIAVFNLFLVIALVLISLIAVSQASPDSTMGNILIGWIHGLGYEHEEYGYYEAGGVLGSFLFHGIAVALTSLSISYKWHKLAVLAPAFWALLACGPGSPCGSVMAVVCLACILAPQSQAYLKGEDPNTPPTPDVY